MQSRGKPEAFQASVRKPDDFDLFWRAVNDDLAAIPPDVELTRRPERSTPEVEVFDVRYTSLDGVRIAAWYCRPRSASASDRAPGLAIMPGYVSEPTLPTSWARQGYAALGAAPRGKLRSNAQFNPGYPGLLVHRIEDKHTYSYRGFYADALRAIDVLAGMPEVDAGRIGVTGGSQGGALTLMTSALRPDRIRCGALSAPYLTGFFESAALTRSYPYEEMNEYFHVHPEREAAARATTAYFDCLNFADRIRAPLYLHVGNADDICPPELAYVLRERLTCPLTFSAHDGAGHEAGLFWEQERVEAFLAGHLQPVAVADPPRPQTFTTSRSARLDDWNAGIEADLAAMPPAITITKDHRRSGEEMDIFRVEMTSVDNYVIAAWLTIPHGDGPFPALLYAPTPMSVVTPAPYEYRARYVTMSVMSRGQRGADTPYAAAFPGHLTKGIDDPDRWTMRGVLADTLRALDVLAELPQVDPARIGLTGNDLALAVAARRSQTVAAVSPGTSFWYKTRELASGTDLYPLQEFNDYARTYPDKTDAMDESLALLDPQWMAENIRARVLLPVDDAGRTTSTAWYGPLADAMPGPPDHVAMSHLGQTDYDAVDAWFANVLGTIPSPRTWQPEDIGAWSR